MFRLAHFKRPMAAFLIALGAVAGPVIAEDSAEARFFIREFRVQGADTLPRGEVERAVYPFMGPGRTADDVESARAALEALYQDKGYQTVMVDIPPQQVRRGVVILSVSEGTVGRLRVRGSRYHDIEQIRRDAPSMAEGSVPNFNHVVRDIVALNQMPARRITPEIKPGIEPGTVDIDLLVEDELPLNASLELNNRYSSGTKPLRLNASARYDNLWQQGHSIGASVQTAPQATSEVLVFSGFYSARTRHLPGWMFLLQGTKQDTNISTLGGVAVAGKGDTAGFRAIYTLPSEGGLFQSLSFGMDWKRYSQEVDFGEETTLTPITYYPFNLLYSLVLGRERSLTELYTGFTWHLRGLGSDAAEWDANRFRADGGFLTWRTEFAHTHDLPAGFSLYGRAQGQLASGPLVSSEQFAGGGLDTVRGYLEGETLGDNALIGTLELRTPDLLLEEHEQRAVFAHFFAEGGYLTLRQALPEQRALFRPASVGFGLRFQANPYIGGSLDIAVPLRSQSDTSAGETRITFTLKGEL